MQSDLPRLLWIEDDVELVRNLRRLLGPGLCISHAVRAEDGLRRARAELPDLIVLDLHLPPTLTDLEEEEGLELLRQMREQRDLNIPVVVVTRAAGSLQAQQALALGAKVVLGKPVDTAALNRVVTALLQENQAVDRNSRRGGELRVQNPPEKKEGPS